MPEKPDELEKECIILDEWLYLYYEPTVLSTGRHVEKNEDAANYDWAMPENLNDKDEDWFATEITCS